MEAHRLAPATRARLAWPVALLGLALIAFVVLTGRAQAGLPAGVGDRAESSQASLIRAVNKLAASVDRPAPRISVGEAKAEAPTGQALPEVRNSAGEPLELTDDACEANVGLAASKGLRLPAGWEIHCVGPGLDWEGGSHWGVTCPYRECPEGEGPYVSISNPSYYVVAHELCHANFGNDELMADSCAAEHGASLETSPYQ